MNINILWITFNYVDYVHLCKIIQLFMLLIFIWIFFFCLLVLIEIENWIYYGLYLKLCATISIVNIYYWKYLKFYFFIVLFPDWKLNVLWNIFRILKLCNYEHIDNIYKFCLFAVLLKIKNYCVLYKRILK